MVGQLLQQDKATNSSAGSPVVPVNTLNAGVPFHPWYTTAHVRYAVPRSSNYVASWLCRAYLSSG